MCVWLFPFPLSLSFLTFLPSLMPLLPFPLFHLLFPFSLSPSFYPFPLFSSFSPQTQWKLIFPPPWRGLTEKYTPLRKKVNLYNVFTHCKLIYFKLPSSQITDVRMNHCNQANLIFFDERGGVVNECFQNSIFYN